VLRHKTVLALVRLSVLRFLLASDLIEVQHGVPCPLIVSSTSVLLASELEVSQDELASEVAAVQHEVPKGFFLSCDLQEVQH